MNLSFPFVSIFNFNYDMSPYFFGIQKFENNNIENNKLKNFGLNIKYLKLIVLQLRAELPFGAKKNDAIKWERQLANYLHKYY